MTMDGIFVKNIQNHETCSNLQCTSNTKMLYKEICIWKPASKVILLLFYKRHQFWKLVGCWFPRGGNYHSIPSADVTDGLSSQLVYTIVKLTHQHFGSLFPFIRSICWHFFATSVIFHLVSTSNKQYCIKLIDPSTEGINRTNQRESIYPSTLVVAIIHLHFFWTRKKSHWKHEYS